MAKLKLGRADLFIVVFALLALGALGAGRVWGGDGWLEKRFDPFLRRYPFLLKLLG